MPNWNNNDIKIQYTRALKKGWIDHFRVCGTDYGFSISVLMAVASRETNMQNIIGDHGHGYGIMQIDVGSFPDWCHSGIWQDVNAAITKGTQVLDIKRSQIKLGQGRTLKVGNKSFAGAVINSDEDLLRISLAAYNSGTWAYYNFSTNGDPDRTTTGHDYSADVLARAAVFQALKP